MTNETGTGDQFDPEQEQERLDELGEDIQRTREKAEDDGVLRDDDQQRFVDDGDTDDPFDGQVIAPPA